jgi:3',5'-nucleoside bisphosphate phosphatase
MRALNADLHCHSIISDGLLTPADVVRRAHANGVELLSLTDHDETGGLAEARSMAAELGVPFVNGVEISISWGEDQTVHIIGLGIDADNEALLAGLHDVRSGRDARAVRMADELAKAGIQGAYEGALKFVGNPALVSRSHFARYIVESGYAKDVKSVFDYWLAKGKPGYVEHKWASLADAVTWIVGAGGVAVIAHPGRYRLTSRQRHKLFTEFKNLGGQGIEVLSGSHHDDEVREYAKIATDYGFVASRASDFHGVGESRVDLGKLPDLPAHLTPVWSLLTPVVSDSRAH